MSQELYKLSLSQEMLKQDVKEARKKEHVRMKKKYGDLLFCMDLLIILAVIFNLGALAITNALVIKAEPDSIFVEVNEVTADLHGYEKAPKGIADEKMNAFILVSVYWFSFIGFYILMRRHFYKEGHLTYMILVIVWILTITSIDFFNNFGYYTGMSIFGGLG